MPISTPGPMPPSWRDVTGRFYTQGMPEDTKALSEHVLTRDEFLQQAALAARRSRRVSTGRCSTGSRTGCSSTTSAISTRCRTCCGGRAIRLTPRTIRVADARYADVIDDLYVAFDRIVGDTLGGSEPDTTLIVMSDHGFTSWRRAFHLNSWLRDHGYLAVVDPNASGRSRPVSERRLVPHPGLRSRPERPVHQSSRPRAVGNRGGRGPRAARRGDSAGAARRRSIRRRAARP